MFPLLCLGALEIGLRWFAVGYSSDLLQPVRVDGRKMWADNPFFAYRFFSPPLARTPARR